MFHKNLIFTEKIATCYKSSVGAGLAPALYACPCPLRIYFLLLQQGAGASPAPTIFYPC